LIGVPSLTSPHLNLVTGGETSSTEIETLGLARPLYVLRGRDSEMLVRVVCRAGPNLHFHPIGGASICHIETHIAIHNDGLAVLRPQLRAGAVAWLDDDCSTVGIGGRSQTHAATRSRLDGMTGSRRRGGAARTRREGPFLVPAAGAGPDLHKVTIRNTTACQIQAA